MREQRLRLRTVLTMIAVAVMSLASSVTGLLLFMTQYMNRVSNALTISVENMRATEETQIALLRHEREPGPLTTQAFEEEMLRNLATVRRSATAETAQAVTDAEVLVRAYIEAARSPTPPPGLEQQLAAAFRVLDEISDRYIAEAHLARDTAARWDRRLNVLGTLAIGMVLALTGWLLWWMRTQAFQPVLELARAMERFGRGEHDVRAEEKGPTELREMVERFNQMAAALAAQRKAQVAFLAGVAHDLRNPLSALSLSVALIHPDQPLPPEPRIRRTIELVRRQLKKLERMVGDYMELTSIDAGQLTLHIEPRDLSQLVREVVELFEATQPEQRIELALPTEAIVIPCDPLRIEQVVSNLISNAIKYSPRTHQIEVTVARTGEEALLEVRDHGMGISEDDQRRLFEPFHRARLSKDSVPGAGLGLYVVQRLIAAHSGSIEVSSAPGQGARFTVRLPLSAVSARLPEDASERSAAPG